MCKNINVSLNCQEVSIYLKYSTPHPLRKLVKMGGKVDVSKSISDGEHKTFFEIKEVRKMSYVKIFLWSIVAQEGTNILIFYTFEYGAECSAESGAK